MKRPSASKERRAFVCVDGWAGRGQIPVLVVGETPTKYLVKALQNGTKLPRRILQTGEQTTVPKYAVRFA